MAKKAAKKTSSPGLRPPPKVKTYGWTATFSAEAIRGLLGIPDHHRQCRAIVATTSQTRVAQLVGVDRPGQLFNLSETGNDLEIATAMADPGQIYIAPLDGRRTYHKYDPSLGVIR